MQNSSGLFGLIVLWIIVSVFFCITYPLHASEENKHQKKNPVRINNLVIDVASLPSAMTYNASDAYQRRPQLPFYADAQEGLPKCTPVGVGCSVFCILLCGVVVILFVHYS